MSVRESDVSILIPSYRRPEMTLTAVRSACATGTSEIIISDDASGDGTPQRLASIRDPRVRLIIQPRNLGLWKNHLALLKMVTRPWVKFIQNDDRIEPGGLSAMVAQVGPYTAVVGGLSITEDAATGVRRQPFLLQAPRRWSSDEYLERMIYRGNELGTPSDTLYRLDALDLSDEVWQNDRSMDLLCNANAASRGEVVIMPPGGIITVDHSERDTYCAGFEMSIRRTITTIEYLLTHRDSRVRRLGQVYGFAEALASIRTALGAFRRHHSIYPMYFRDFAHLLSITASWRLLGEGGNVVRFFRRRYQSATPRPLS